MTHNQPQKQVGTHKVLLVSRDTEMHLVASQVKHEVIWHVLVEHVVQVTEQTPETQIAVLKY
jgi:hypothetical protein